MENKIGSFSINNSEIKSAIQLVGPAVPGNAIVPACEFIEFKLRKDGWLLLTATDTSFLISTSVLTAEAVLLEEVGGFQINLVPYKLLSSLLSTLPNTPILFEFYKDEIPKTKSSELQGYVYGVKVIQGKNEYVLGGEESIEFPTLKFKADKSFTMDAAQFAEGYKHAKTFYDPADTGRPGMAGLRLDLTAELVEISGVSPTKICVFGTTQKSEIVAAFTVQDKFASSLANHIGDKIGEIKFSISGNMVKAKFGTFTAVSTLVEGQFPDYRVAIPKDFVHETSLNLEEWRLHLKRALIFGDAETGLIKHKFVNDMLFIESMNSNYNTSSQQHILVSDEIEDFAIGLRGKDVVNGTSTVGGKAEMKMIADNRCVVVVPESHGGSSLTFLFMPYRLD